MFAIPRVQYCGVSHQRMLTNEGSQHVGCIDFYLLGQLLGFLETGVECLEIKLLCTFGDAR